jgi:hypothetical protein
VVKFVVESNVLQMQKDRESVPAQAQLLYDQKELIYDFMTYILVLWYVTLPSIKNLDI